jgi:hypothetical protein
MNRDISLLLTGLKLRRQWLLTVLKLETKKIGVAKATPQLKGIIWKAQ